MRETSPATSPPGRAMGRVAVLCALLAVMVFSIAGCGSGGGSSGSTAEGSLSSTAASGTTAAGRGHAGTTGPPPVKETIDDAAQRIEQTVASGNCRRINALAPLAGASVENTAEHCRSLRTLASLQPAGIAAYGEGGGVIDYGAGDHVVSAVLIRDADGLFHIAFVNPYNSSQTVGTPFAEEYDAVAASAIKALRDGDCDAFLQVADRRLGVASLSRQQACRSVTAKAGLGRLLAGAPHAMPDRLGGNDYYAFYGLSLPTAHLTIVEAKEGRALPSSLAPAAPHLPAGAPTYGYVQAYLTNSSAPRGPGGA
jgi:hypothetical protein